MTPERNKFGIYYFLVYFYHISTYPQTNEYQLGGNPAPKGAPGTIWNILGYHVYNQWVEARVQGSPQ